MNRKHLVVALAVCTIFSLLLGQTVFASGGGKCDGNTSVAAPTNLRLTAKTDTTANIQWSAPSNSRGIAGYNIYRGGALVGTTAKSTLKFTDTGLTPNTYYTWTVKAVSTAKKLSASSNKLTTATPIIIRDAVTWSAGSAPQAINGGLIVEQSGFLSIGPGVILKIKPCQNVTVYGSVDAAGSEAAPVAFTATGDKAYGGCGVGNGYWGTILIASGGSFSGDWVKITYADTLATVKGYLSLTNSEIAYAKTMGIFVDRAGEFNGINDKIHDCCTAGKCRGIDTKGVVNLSNSSIYDCPGTGVLVETTGTFNGTSVTISNCEKGVEIQGQINFVLCSVTDCKYALYFNTTASNPVILNTFMGNDLYGVYNARSKAVTVDASSNFWGSPLGPSVYDATTGKWSEAGDRVSAGVFYDNWLTAPAA